MIATVKRHSSLSSKSSAGKDFEVLVSKGYEQETLESAACSTMASESVNDTSLATHEVNVNLLGVAGITVDRKSCRDASKNITAPPPPEDMKAIISIRELNSPSCETLLKSEWSSCLKKSAQTEEDDDTKHKNSQTSPCNTSRYLALWNSNNALPGSPFSFETQMEVDSDGKAKRKSFELILSLVDTASSEKDLLIVPLGSSILTLEGIGNSSIIDLPVENVLPSDFHRVETAENPNYVRKEEKTPKPTPERIKPKRKFNFFNRRRHRQQLKEDLDEDDEKKEDDQEGYDRFQSIDLSRAYAVDQTGDAVLRLELDWKMRAPVIESNIDNASKRGRGLIQPRKHSTKRNSMTENSGIEEKAKDPSLKSNFSDKVAPDAVLHVVTEEACQIEDQPDRAPVFEVKPDNLSEENFSPTRTTGCTTPYFERMWENNWGFEWGSKRKEQTKSDGFVLGSNEEIIQFGQAVVPDREKPAETKNNIKQQGTEKVTSPRFEENPITEVVKIPENENVNSATVAGPTNNLFGRVSPDSKTIKTSDQDRESNSDEVQESFERVLSWDRSIRSGNSKSAKPPSDTGSENFPLTNAIIEKSLSWSQKDCSSQWDESQVSKTNSNVQNDRKQTTDSAVERVVSWDERSIKSQKSVSPQQKEHLSTVEIDSHGQSSTPTENTAVPQNLTGKDVSSEEDLMVRSPSPIPEEKPGDIDENGSTHSSKGSKSPSQHSNGIQPKPTGHLSRSRSSSSIVSSSSSVNVSNSICSSTAKSKRSSAYERRLFRQQSNRSDAASNVDIRHLGSLSLSQSMSYDLSKKGEHDESAMESTRVPTPSNHSVYSRSLRGEELVSETGTDDGPRVNTDLIVRGTATTSEVSTDNNKQNDSGFAMENVAIEQKDAQLELVFTQSETTRSAVSTTSKSDSTTSRQEIGNEAAIRAMSEAAKRALNPEEEAQPMTDEESQKGTHKGNRFTSLSPGQGRLADKWKEGSTPKRAGRAEGRHIQSRQSPRGSPASLPRVTSLDNSARRDGTMSVDESLQRGGSTVKVSNRAPDQSVDTETKDEQVSPEIQGPILSVAEYSNPRLTEDDDAFSFSVTKDSRREYSMRGKKRTLLTGCGVAEALDSAIGRCHEDEEISWQNSLDEESTFTRSTNQTMQRSTGGKTFQLAKNLLRQCGPSQMADLGDAVVEESKELRKMWEKYRRGKNGHVSSHDEQSLRTGTDFLSYTRTNTDNEESYVGESVDNDDAFEAKKEKAIKYSSKGRSSSTVNGGSRFEKPRKVKSAVVSLSEGFLNLVTCTNRFNDPDSSSLISYHVPRELYSSDDRSFGALTASTYERKLDLLQSFSKAEVEGDKETEKENTIKDDEEGVEAKDV